MNTARIYADFIPVVESCRFYNTTYTLFAASIILVYIAQEALETEKQSLFGYVEMSVEILEIMDECLVAKKAAKMIQMALARAKGTPNSVEADPSQRPRDVLGNQASFPFNHYWGPLDLVQGDIDTSFPFELGDLDEIQGPFGEFSTIDGV
jgi:hypothetical protein